MMYAFLSEETFHVNVSFVTVDSSQCWNTPRGVKSGSEENILLHADEYNKGTTSCAFTKIKVRLNEVN